MYLFFDTETTGLPKRWKAPITDLENWPRVVQVAWIECDAEGQTLASYDYIIKPENFEIPAESAAIHGITTDIALSRGKPLGEVLNAFSTALNRSQTLIAHNMSFDEKVLGAEFLRKGSEVPFASLRQLCTKELSTNFCKLPSAYGYKWPTLQELHTKIFGHAFEEAHNASVDVEACMRCFFELKKRGVIV